MSGQIDVQKGNTGFLPFSTKLYKGGPLVAPDSAPTVTNVVINGTAVATTGYTVVQVQDDTPANFTGRYRVEFDSSAMTKGQQGQVDVQATIGGLAIDIEDVLTFLIIDDPTPPPVIE